MIRIKDVEAAVKHLDNHLAQGIPTITHEFNTLSYALSIAVGTVDPPLPAEVRTGQAAKELRKLLAALLPSPYAGAGGV